MVLLANKVRAFLWRNVSCGHLIHRGQADLEDERVVQESQGKKLAEVRRILPGLHVAVFATISY